MDKFMLNEARAKLISCKSEGILSEFYGKGWFINYINEKRKGAVETSYSSLGTSYIASYADNMEDFRIWYHKNRTKPWIKT